MNQVRASRALARLRSLASARHAEFRAFASRAHKDAAPYAFLMRGPRLRDGALTAFGARWRGQQPEGFAVTDVVYLAVGVGVLALMALYALACDRL